MSSTTKKPPIDENSKEFVSNLETTSDLYRSYDAYQKAMSEQTNRKKNTIARDIELNAETYIEEIEEKVKLKEEERLEKIDFIISKTKQKLVKSKELYNMSNEEVETIYIKAKDYNKSWLTKIIEFVMGW